MLDTAENVAEQGGFSRQELDDLTLLRHEQYTASLAGDRAAQRRYLVPVHVPGAGRGDGRVVDTDVGVHHTTAEGLAKLAPLKPRCPTTSATTMPTA
jgi:acetyl-CoA acetyltransferase